MKPAQTAENYDKLADHWNGDAFHRANGVAQHERALKFVASRGAALDAGCGSSGRIIDRMLAAGFEAEGLDISGEMLRLAKERHPGVTFHHADIRSWEFPRSYAFISAWDSIWHVPLEDQQAVIAKLCGALTGGGVLIFTSGGVDEPGEATNPFLGQPLYHAAPGITALLETIARNGCVCRHLEYDQYPESHIYLIVQKPANAPATDD